MQTGKVAQFHSLTNEEMKELINKVINNNRKILTNLEEYDRTGIYKSTGKFDKYNKTNNADGVNCDE